jgi:integrase/recombinase XerC
MGVASLAVSFERARRAEGLSPHTLKLYRDCIRRLVTYLDDDPTRLTRRELTDFFAVRSESVAAATVWTDWKCIRVYVKWLVQEEELSSDPMVKMKPPRQTSRPVPVLSEADLKALVVSCEGGTRRDRRDMAAMRLLLEGLRRGEVCGLTVADVDLDDRTVTVTGKRKTRTVAIGVRTVLSLDRWMRVRRDQAPSPSTPLFGVTPSGLYQALRARAEAAGIAGWHPHRMRHTAAHQWLLARGGESDLMQVMGWSSPAMLRRYGASAAAERARLASRTLGLSDKV